MPVCSWFQFNVDSWPVECPSVSPILCIYFGKFLNLFFIPSGGFFVEHEVNAHLLVIGQHFQRASLSVDHQYFVWPPQKKYLTPLWLECPSPGDVKVILV